MPRMTELHSGGEQRTAYGWVTTKEKKERDDDSINKKRKAEQCNLVLSTRHNNIRFKTQTMLSKELSGAVTEAAVAEVVIFSLWAA